MWPSEDIVESRFAINESGRIAYRSDVIAGNGAVVCKSGQLVRIKECGSVEFRIGKVRYSLPAGAVAFCLAYRKLPAKTVMQIVIQPSADRPDDYRTENLRYTTNSDIQEAGGMRVAFCNGWQAKRYISKTGGVAVRYFQTQKEALRFAAILHRWMLKTAYREFWANVGIAADVRSITLCPARIATD